MEQILVSKRGIQKQLIYKLKNKNHELQSTILLNIWLSDLEIQTKVKQKINTRQRGLERTIQNIKKKDKVRNTSIRKVTKATNALTYAQKLKWKFSHGNASSHIKSCERIATTIKYFVSRRTC